jgi:hypothetical protein
MPDDGRDGRSDRSDIDLPVFQLRDAPFHAVAPARLAIVEPMD